MLKNWLDHGMSSHAGAVVEEQSIYLCDYAVYSIYQKSTLVIG
jgi:hypothetical protein